MATPTLILTGEPLVRFAQARRGALAEASSSSGGYWRGGPTRPSTSRR